MNYGIGQVVLANRSVNRELDKYGGPQWKPGKIASISRGLLDHEPIYWVFFLDGNGAVFVDEKNVKPLGSEDAL